jgi:hypothetical protein
MEPVGSEVIGEVKAGPDSAEIAVEVHLASLGYGEGVE